MFFPCLEDLKSVKYPEQTIELFDWWLGSRKKNSLRTLNPLQFSLDSGIDNSIALSLFSHCVYDRKINLFKIRVVYYCPICNHRMISGKEEVQETFLICRNCESAISEEILKERLEIYFELIKQPENSSPSYRHSDLIAGVYSEKKLRAFVRQTYTSIVR